MAKWPSDKELEEIYRKGSEQHDFKYDPKAWDQLNMMLNKKRRRKILFLFFIGIFLLSTLAISFYNTSNFKNTNTEVSETIETIPSENKTSLEIKSPDIHNLRSESHSENEETTEAVDIKNSNIESDVSINSIFEKISDRAQLGQNENYNSDLNQTNIDIENSNKSSLTKLSNQDSNIPSIKSDEQNVQKNVAVNTSMSQAETSLGDNYSNSYQNDQHQTDLLQVTMIQGLNINQLENSESGLFTIPELVETQLSEDKNNSSAFAINTMIGLESSWTPNGEYSKVDLSFGLGGTYFFNQKLGVSLGVHYISDTYTAMAADYSPPKGYWENRGVPSWTKATCNMIETSYGISYYFNGRNNRGFGIDFSLLSNLMVSEDYYYHYEDRDKNFVSSWNMDNSTFISSISIATDYNIPISSKTLLRIGPFVKLPLEGIGHGKVMLSSFGIRMQASFLTK